MRTSESTTALARLPWAQAPAVTQIHPESELDVRPAIQRRDADRPFVDKWFEPAEVRSDRFGCFRPSFFCWNEKCPWLLEAAPWRS
jgi:hypothetical protein